jgi:hypothetical protein
MDNAWTGPDRRRAVPGRRIADFEREHENHEMRQEIARLKAVVEVLADAVQALTALQNKPHAVQLQQRLAR